MDNYQFLYSDEQIINIDDEKDSYNLEFNIESYNDDILLIGGKFLNTKMLDNCKVTGKKLICQTKKEDLIKILPINGGNLFLYYYISGDKDIKQYPNVFNIKINIKNLKKETIYVGINKLLNFDLKEYGFAAFETNITIISNIITEQYKVNTNNYTCYLKKDPDKSLLMLCTGFKKGEYSLRELIKEEIILDYINVKYNFIIHPTINEERFKVDEGGGFIRFSGPNIINFSKNSQGNFLFLYIGENFNSLNFRLGPDSATNSQRCSNSFCFCGISRDSFEGNQDGYYNLYYSNSRYSNFYSIFYEVQPFEITLPKSKNINIRIKNNIEPINIGKNGIICFETNYNDSETNIFDVSDIEKRTKYESAIYDNERSIIIYCRF